MAAAAAEQGWQTDTTEQGCGGLGNESKERGQSGMALS